MKFNERRKCPKCGKDNCSSKYESAYGIEHIKRICPRCGYTWTEEVLDKEEGK